MKVEKRNLNEALNYYKVIYDTAPPEKMIAFVLPNKGSSADLRTLIKGL